MVETEATGGDTTLLSPEPATTSWHGEENAEFVKQKGWENGDAAVKSYRELEKMSSGRVKVPSPESSAEEIRAFYSKSGCPENPDGYDLVVPEDAEIFRDEATEKALAGIAHEYGVSKMAFEKIVGAYYEKMATDLRVGREQGEASLKEELGDKYDEEIKIAQRFNENCSEEFQKLMETTGLGNNPIILKEFMALGKKTLSDTLIKGEHVDPDAKAYKPQYPNSPEMYRSMEGPEGEKARAWHVAHGHTY